MTGRHGCLEDGCSCDLSVLWAAFSHLSTVTVEEVAVDDGVMTFSARTATRQAVCPGCGTVSGRVHGGCRRRLADVAVSGHRTVTDLLVSQFRQVDGLTERFARRTASPHRALEKIALALAGRPAARLAAHLSIPTSPNSLLRLPRSHIAWGQAVAAVALFAALGGGLWASEMASGNGSSSPPAASCSDEKPGKAAGRVTGAQLCEALLRPDLAKLLGTPTETAKTASGSDGSVGLSGGKDIPTRPPRSSSTRTP